MEISEIIKDALVYPLNNVKSLILFVIIGAITGILGGASLIAMASKHQAIIMLLLVDLDLLEY